MGPEGSYPHENVPLFGRMPPAEVVISYYDSVYGPQTLPGTYIGGLPDIRRTPVIRFTDPDGRGLEILGGVECKVERPDDPGSPGESSTAA
jgi:hypothetical protein